VNKTTTPPTFFIRASGKAKYEIPKPVHTKAEAVKAVWLRDIQQV
jgi:hypothetical protein